MFHRVLPTEGDAWSKADPGYTVSRELFAGCLRFFRRFYAVVSLSDVLAALDGGPRLPPCALLISFDDGWRDSATCAWPLLRREGLPAVDFVAGDAVVDPQPDWWQESLLRGLRQGRATYEELWRAVPADGAPAPDAASGDRLVRLLCRFAAIDDAVRRRILAGLKPAQEVPERDMIDVARLPVLATDGLAIASHGASHLPLTMLSDRAEDLQRSRQILSSVLGAEHHCLRALSFPHGRYDSTTIAEAAGLGFDLMFCSVACLNDAPDGRPASRLLGRIEIATRHIADADGRLEPHRLASWLFVRPMCRLHGQVAA
jgi:peptidoglycan/xylan/chitin deacetylase (PgdA/CDA1 family)